MVVLDNVVIFTKFFFEFIISTGIAFVFFTVLVAVVLDMVAEYCETKAEYCEVKKCEVKKEKKKKREKEKEKEKGKEDEEKNEKEKK